VGALVRARHQPPLSPPLPLPHALIARAWPRGGSESKWMMSSVPGIPLDLGQRASCVSRLCQDQRKINVDYSTNLLLGRILVMSDGKCKSNFVSLSVVPSATVEQI
jgi:hypothetical protein